MAVCDAAEQRRLHNSTTTVLVDVGAAPYGDIGGDMTHTLTFLRACRRANRILSYEPGTAPFKRLQDAVRKEQGDGLVGPPIVELRNVPLSESSRTVSLSNQPGAGNNTASIEPLIYDQTELRTALASSSVTVRSATLDDELRSRSLHESEVLILKVDVEGHEMAVLRGARQAMITRRVPTILLEYGDKFSHAIFCAMKRQGSAAAAAASPAELSQAGPSLYSLQQWADSLGYDTFLVGSLSWRKRPSSSRSRGAGAKPSSWRPPVLIGITGPLWRDDYEVCRDKSAKWSANGRTWNNFSVWNPRHEATCWYDVALIHRRPRFPEVRRELLAAMSLPRAFCHRLEASWYPSWIDAPPPPPESLCCNHRVLDPVGGDVCHTFVKCAG